MTIAYIYKTRIRRRLTGDVGINPARGCPPRKLSVGQELALGAHIRSRLGITLAPAQNWLLAEHGISLSTGATWKAAQSFIDPEALVFLDETGVNTKMARLYGWAPVDERCRDSPLATGRR